ncbi:hypothetical protein [Streptomyces sp. WZ.A104]|uniref:hypothetical protein n=1 Tax=Streptomyces sp. WZ.A104 TaxID=2023771 RepID=UPI00211C622A|nr:hypothetical protein [Streptomyces sp. WZ.A104]
MLVHAANRARALTRLRNLGLRAVYLRGNDRPPTPDEVTAVLHHPDGLLWRGVPQADASGRPDASGRADTSGRPGGLVPRSPHLPQSSHPPQSSQSCQELWHPIRALLGPSGHAGPARPAA